MSSTGNAWSDHPGSNSVAAMSSLVHTEAGDIPGPSGVVGADPSGSRGGATPSTTPGTGAGGTRPPRRRWRPVVIAVGAVLLAVVAVLGIEVGLARHGPAPTNPAGFGPQLNGVVGPTGDATRPVRIVWLGDSTAAGVCATSPERALPRQVAAGLQRPVALDVFATPGARAGDVLAHQVPQVSALGADQQPDLIIVSVGTEDVTSLTSNNTFRSQYLAILDALPRGADKILLGVPDLGSAPRFAQPLRWMAGVRAGTLDAVVENMRDHGADYVNIADFTGPASAADPGTYFCADLLHPSDAGYQRWADTVVPVVKWRLFKREHPQDPEPLQPKEAKGTVKTSDQ
jgi:lysophospholipase L1-like esterase